MSVGFTERIQEPVKPTSRGNRRTGDPKEDFKNDVRKSLLCITENADNIPTLLTLLLAADVISENDMERVNSQTTKADQLRTLTLLFTRKTLADWEAFKQALVDSRNEHVAEEIERICGVRQ